MTKLFDTHAHPHFAAYKNDSAEVIQRALQAGVMMIAVGTKYDTSRAAVECAEKYEGVWAAVGLHPIHLASGYYDPNEDGAKTTPGFTRRAESFDIDLFRQLALSSSKVVAIGETGLDYYRLNGDQTEQESAKLNQRLAFQAEAELAAELNKTLIVHCRDAHAEAYQIIAATKKQHPSLRCIIHCFTGTAAEGKKYLALDAYISFPGIITFAHDWDNFIPSLPPEHLLAETDSPYLSPVPNRGKRNEPSNVEYVVRRLAELRGVSYENMAAQTTANAYRAFGLDV